MKPLLNMWSFLVVLSSIFKVASSNPISAPVGGSVTLECSHFWAFLSTKYFCRDSCAVENILIQSETRENPTRRERYTLYDKGSDFTVTIADLQLSDSGTYVCAVERLLKDTYMYLTLHVTEGVTRPTTSRAFTDKTDLFESKETLVTRPWTTLTSTETMRRSALSDPLVYVGAGLGVLLLTFAAAFFIFIKLKYKQSRCFSSVTSTHEPEYVNYTTANFPEQPDTLNYSSVAFLKKTDSRVENSENNPAETHYSSVKLKTTDQDSVIYSTVSAV
ncbi:CMRF35-like molecule 9 isoform X2 [Danio aesculapii]|uniref:CMRF35-like molecule 9 isoform X2 n=1 Tax=Danio aesculapii TaxID=1142201 RepID=UPI0024C0E63B|nr:CMRF35-like molecule 9 isoform X2 [Danio aesculapii]